MALLHLMKLNGEPFEKILSGRKTVELRLRDEKRRQVQVGDYICFSRTDDETAKVTVRVTDLHCFGSFRELYEALPKEKCGYSAGESADPADMDLYYSKERQAEYGALGIEFRLTALQKFIDAQERGCDFGETYQTALSEIRNGRKQTHWIWYVLPQIKGLGGDALTERFAVKNLSEAVDYCEHPVLGARLLEIAGELLGQDAYDPVSVMGSYVDAYKLRSCMTLFIHAAPDAPVFRNVLEKYCLGKECDKTLTLIGRK